MYSSSDKKGILLLENGLLFEGFSFGYVGTVIGEVVFNTGMTGYQEVLTDPSYYGQLVTFTFPEIGNTGVNINDQESDSSVVKGIVVRQFTSIPSNWRSESSFEDWLIDQKVIGLSGIDTRSLVFSLRDAGTLNAVISTDGNYSIKQLLEILKESPSMNGLNLVSKVSTKVNYKWNKISPILFDQRIKQNTVKPYNIVAVDFGIKRSILNRLTSYGCDITVVPSDINYDELKRINPEGVFLSNGPGDPSTVIEGIKLVRDLINDATTPIFGICLGHQILGLGLGGKTFKLPYGHRGLNHPCGTSGKVEITSQNHGFALDPDSLPKDKVQITHFNLNDNTVAAIEGRNLPFFGVQYHPEASPGPHDADYHFQRFVDLMEERRRSVV